MGTTSRDSDSTNQAAPQVRFFEDIKRNHPEGENLGARLMEILHLSQDSVYRRMRGETALTFDELAIVADYFKVSIDGFFGLESDQASIGFRFYRLNSGSYHEYLKFIMEEFQKSELGVDQQIVYSAKDIPVFYFFLFPELAVFKAFFFGKILWTNDTFKDLHFDFEKVYEVMGAPRPVLEQIGLSLAKSYMQIPGTEIWNHSTINGHLYQVRYLWEAGQFANKESALSILKNTDRLLQHIKTQAEEGTKFLSAVKREVGAETQFYFSEGIHLENAILQTKADQKKCYVLHNTGDYLITTDSAFCGRTDEYLNNVLSKSSLISKVGAKDRQRLFRNYADKIDKLRRLIES